MAAATKLARLGEAESQARTWIIGHQLKEYLAEVSPRRLAEVERTQMRVDQRLAHESNRLIGEAIAAQEKEQTGTRPKESSDSLMRKAQDLQARRETRLALLDQQAQLATKPPRTMTAALVLPLAMVAPRSQRTPPSRPRRPRPSSGAASTWCSPQSVLSAGSRRSRRSTTPATTSSAPAGRRLGPPAPRPSDP